jgi:hypothetical protein
MRYRLLLAVGVCALALSLRLRQAQQIPLAAWHATEPHHVAVSLAEGRGWADPFKEATGPTAHVAPLYPLLLSALYRCFGSYETVTGRVAQQTLSITIVILELLALPVLARKLRLSESAGWAAAFLGAWLPAHQWDEVMGAHDQVASTLGLLVLLGILADLQRSGWRRHVLPAGLILGLASLLAPPLLAGAVLFFLAEVAVRARERKQILRGGLICFAASLAVLTPWMVRNSVVLGGFVPLRSNFGLELAVGNRPGATGHTYGEGFGEMHPFESPEECARIRKIGELAYMEEKKQQALDWIVAHRSEFVLLTLRRACLFWFSTDERWYSLEPRFRLPIRIYGLLGIGALLALARLVYNRTPVGRLLTLMLLGLALPYCLTHVESRYRLPIVGLSALLSCHLVVAGLRRILRELQRPTSPKVESLPPTVRAA